MKKPLAIGIALWFAFWIVLSILAIRSTHSQSGLASSAPLMQVPSLADIKNQVADDQAKQYWIARRNSIGHDGRDAYVHAKLAAEAYLQAGDEENYRKWKRIAHDLPASDTPQPEPIQQREFTEKDADDQLRGIVAGQKSPEQQKQEYDEVIAQQQAEQDKRVHAAMEASRESGVKQRTEADKIRAIEDAAAKAASDGSIKAAKIKRFHDAIESNQPRPWKTFGGQAASRAKIVGYDNGVFTLEKADGKQVELRESRMTKVDKDYCEEWLAKAGAD